MELILVGDRFEQELKPLVKSFFQNDPPQVKIEELDEELAWPVVAEGKLLYCTRGGEEDIYTEPYEVEYGCVIHTGAERFHVAFIKDGVVTQYTEETVFPAEEIESDGTGTSEASRRKYYRNQLGRAVYRILSQETGKTLPWGILTGVRPTKLVVEMLEAGEEATAIREHMRDEYLCSGEKIEVSLRVAENERRLLEKIDYKKGYSLYLGIPFCPTTCHYCSFTSFPLKGFGQWVEPYLDALEKEIDAASTIFPDRPLHTVYIGGGTPTTLTPEQLERVITRVKKRFDLSSCVEFTVEAGRPDSVTPEKLRTLKELGVDRISINPQTMNNKTLEAIGRRHTAEQVVEAFRMARECGHDNINMDMILGLSGETPEEVAYTLSEIEKLNPDSLTVHTLALKRAARLNIEGQKFRDIGAEDVPWMLKLTSEYAAAHSYEPYYLYRQKNMAENLENVGYARPGKECLYNILIMEEKQTILALGAGGSTKFVYQGSEPAEGIRIERVENVKNVNHYIDRIDEMIARRPQFLQENTTGLFL